MGKLCKTMRVLRILFSKCFRLSRPRAVDSALWAAAPLCQIVAEISKFKSTTVKT